MSDPTPHDPKRLPDYKRPVLPFERDVDPEARQTGLAAVGLEFGIVVTLFFLGGRALDAKLGGEPWWTAGASLVGVAIGTWLLLRRVIRAQDSPSSGRRTKDPKDADLTGRN